MIKLTAIGNLGKDAVVNNANGKSVINFSVCHTEKLRDTQGNVKDKSIWVDCSYWTDKVAIAPYLKKGSQVYVEGSPDVRTYSTADGRNGATLTLRISNIQLLGGTPNKDNNTQSQQSNGGGYQASTPSSTGNPASFGAGELTEPLDDLPF